MIATQTQQLQDLLRKGFQALATGNIPDASECCRRALGIKPDLVEGHFLVGLIALQAKDRDTAFKAFASVTKLKPDHGAAWAHLAKLFMNDGQVNRADVALTEAVKFESGNPVVQDLMGAVYTTMGEYGLAGECFEKAMRGQPDHPPFMLNLANNHIYNGRIEDAEELLQRVVAIQPNTAQAHWSLAGSRKATDDTHIEDMRRLLAAESAHPRMQAFYYYAIGKELEDLQRWDEAFEAFQAGARARRQTVEYDEVAEEKMFTFLEENLTEDWVASGVGHDTPAPIFVLGQPRSGTTLIERIISSHSQVHSAGELQQFSLALRRLSNHKDPRRFSAEFFAASLNLDSAKIGGLYLESCKRMRGDKARFIDKLPQNYLLIPFILKALPRAKIVHLTRDPMDACFASYKQLFADAYLHSYDLEEMARHHCRYRHLMGTWRSRFPGRFLDISYEDTVLDLEGRARELVSYLELPWEDACLKFHERDDAVSTASAVQVREPVHTRSLGRWQKYEQQLEPMKKILADHSLFASGQR
jgi:tetratricopeptide (TPR) repeat protein